MKNIIFLAMSTLPNSGIRILDFAAPDETRITDCQSQLEPVVRYILRQCKGQDVSIVSMATSDTLSARIIGKEDGCRRTVTVPKAGTEKQQLSGEIITSVQGFFEDRIRDSPEWKQVASGSFSYREISLENPEKAIQDSVNEIKSLREKATDDKTRLWIDTHGGIRDVALLINVVGYLLEEFDNFEIAGVYGTETANNKIIDQKNAFYSLAFVSGMSDFMNFGNVDVLKKYYQSEISGGDKDIRDLVDAMQKVSDGMQFCDPDLYKEGLSDLGTVIENRDSGHLQAEKALLPIFYDTIKQDYGNLLDNKHRSDLDIIERCMKKKQYQQALTFIDALMPEYFFEKRILYFSDEDRQVAEAATKESYKSAISNVLDSFLQKFYYCFKRHTDVRNILAVKAGILAGAETADDFDDDIAQALRNANKSKNLSKGMKNKLGIGAKVSVKNKEIQYETDVPDKYSARITRVMQIHRVLKDARNKFNHAALGNAGKDLAERRPQINHIVTIMKLYISEVRSLEKLVDSD